MSTAPTAPPPEPALLVADSFRVRTNPRTGEAEVRGLELHLARFTRSVLAAWPGSAGSVAPAAASDTDQTDQTDFLRDAALQALLDGSAFGAVSVFEFEDAMAGASRTARVRDFFAEALPRIAAFGEGFPRLELWRESAREPELRLALRPLPELRDTIELRTAGSLDLPHADRKGPNITRLAELNRELGAEALLLDRSGRALEGATTSLVWWLGDGAAGAASTGRYVDTGRSGAQRVDSITERLLRGAAQQRLVGRKPHRARTGAFAAGSPTPAELAACEVWAVNALHGIRPVTRIDDAPLPSPDDQRLAWFREALDRTWRPLPKK